VPRKLEVVITGDTVGLERALTRSSAAASTFGGKMQKVGSSMESFGKTLTKSVTLPIVGVGVVAVKMAMDSEASMGRLNAAVKSSGLSVKGFAGQLNGAQDAGRKLGFTNIDIQQGLSKMVVATQSGTKAVVDLRTAEDLARFKHIELGAASQMLAQAMTGSARAVKQLGINVIPATTAMDALKEAHKKSKQPITEQEKATAKLADKMKTGNEVIAEVTKRLKGQAQAYAQTASGGMAQFKAQLENVGEKLGKVMIPVLDKVVGYLSRALSWFDKLSPSTQKWAEITVGAIALIGPALMILGAAIDVVAGSMAVLDALASPWILLAAAIVAVTAAITAAVVAPKQLQAVLEKMGMSAGTAKTVVNDLRATFATLKAVFEDVRAVVQAVWPVIASLVVEKLNEVKAAVAIFSDLLHGRWSALWGDLKNIVMAPLNGIVSLVRASFNLLAGLARGPMDAILGIFERGWTAVKNVTQSVWNSIKSGLSATWRFLESSAISAAIAIIEPFTHIPTKILGVHIPGTGWVSDIQKIKASLEAKLASIDAAGKVKTVFDKARGAVQTTGASVAGAARNVGVSIGSSLAGGISSMIGPVQAAASAIAAAAEVAIRAKSQVHSISPLFKKIGADMMTSVGVGIQSAATGVATAMGNAVITIIEGAIRAAKIALAKAKTDLASSMASFTSAAAGAFDTAGGGSPKTRALAKKLKAEQDAQKAAADAAAEDQRQQALVAAQASGDPVAIAAAEKAIADAKVQAQIDANAKTLAERQKADKDDFERQLAGLEQQAAGAKTEEQVKSIRAKINALFKKYGITPGTVEAGSDWNAAQSLFVGAMGDLNKSMRELIAAINNLTGASSALPSTSAGSLPHHAEGGKTKAGLAMLHNGEYVLKSSATRKIGLPALNHLNWFGHFQDGGPVLPKLNKNPKLSQTTGLPDVPEYRAAAMYLNDWGADRNETPIGTALAGLLGPRAQAQAAIRATHVGGVQLRHGLWRAAGGVVDSKMLDAWKKNYPGITFETGTPGQQISWMQAASRLPMGGQELGSLIASSVGPTGTGANTRGSLVEQLTSHAVHFARGGTALADGLAMLHKNETVIPARGGQPIHLHTTVELDGRVVGRSVQTYLGEQTRWGGNGLPR
jgi:hypothetical protein